jgi:acyl-coenzyme A synthetase/AMP-(fatty) acid ligase
VPKGVVNSHRNVIDYIDTFAETFGIDKTDVFGNQSPLDYVAALRDLFLPLCTGAMTVLLPKVLFSQPVKLFEKINENKITTLCWVASALSLCAELGVFEETVLKNIRHVFFTGSVLPGRHLRIWQDNLPHTKFVNHYGPTEITASCTYYIVDHQVTYDENMPIGIPFSNTDILLLDEAGQPVPDGEMGEICIRGAGLTLGYFKNPEKTREVFVPNPTQPFINETIYKTGDLGKKLPDENYTFHGRRDFQIKHMGHRIELSEIEATALSLPGLGNVCCLYQSEKELIWLFYEGSPTKKELAVHLRERLPGFMVPRRFEQLVKMPKTFNGKIDKAELQKVLK